VVPIKSAVNAKAKTRTKKIQWSKAITHDNGRVIEVEIEYNFHGVPVKGEKSPEQVMEKQKLSFFRLILEKDDEVGYKKYLMKYFPEQKIGSQNKLEINNYSRLSKQFTGEVLLYDWDENLLKGWEMAEGQIIRFFRSREARKGNNGANLAQQCKNYTELICASYPIGDEIVIECTESPVVECAGYPNDTGGSPGGAGWYVGSPSGPGTYTGPGGGGGSGSGSGGLPTLLPEDDDLDLFIPSLTPDDGYFYSGAKKLIPSILSLVNCDEIIVDFGVTESDNKSANQEVTELLIEGLQEAIKKANSNLSSQEKITRIYVAATTNGQHGSTSNHYNGTAIDISRINGSKMASTGVTKQITQLQLAIDDFPNVRENFGPYFKHKYSTESDSWNYNHPVGGHVDHIHFSVR